MEKLQFYANMPIMFYVPYSTHMCKKMQERTKKSSKSAKTSSLKRAQLTKARKFQRAPGLLALNWPKRDS